MIKGLVIDRGFNFARLGNRAICVLSNLQRITLFMLEPVEGCYARSFRFAALLRQSKLVGTGSFLFILSLVILIGLATAAYAAETGGGGLGAGVYPSAENPYPDLLQETENGVTGPDLLDDDPYMSEPDEVLGDPIFEDDFVFNVPPPKIFDPLEPLNRAIFVFNDKVYLANNEVDPYGAIC